ncbi:MAG: hypothetical protein E7C82_03065 [Anaerococcus hydrogenalis]|uniref:hypothetical protein n=1 Tax=Anaerococcus hydrogenalis TaxID=33029 RepID=UPI0029021379|nr:hypothetical protein [Anaerococcus hydrogenalis]MDU2582664.1 hypothetical protein [Anaerococcus hydrogenalis]
MKKKIGLVLCLSLVLTSCGIFDKDNKSNSSNSSVSSESNNKNNLLIGESVDYKSNNLSASNTSNIDSSNELSIDDIKKAMIDLGGFDQSFVDGLSDEDIKKYQKAANDLSEKTGFWNKLTLMFNQIAKENPNTSNIYPETTVEDVVNNWIYSDDQGLDHYTNARTYIGQNGFDASQVPNKELKNIFFEIYDEDKYATYDENIVKASQKLKEKYPNGYEENQNNENNEEKDTQENSKEQTSIDIKNRPIDKFSENKEEYDSFRKDLKNKYKFSKKSIEKITNNDIDLAYLRAQKKLDGKSLDDIELVIKEIAKMYPGSSSMYPGDEN